MSPLQTALRQFQRGLAHDSTEDIYEGYRALYKIGAPVIPVIEDAVLKGKWKNVERPEKIRALAGHVGLIHDIDEMKSREIIEKIIERGCDRVVLSVLESIRRFTRTDYKIFELSGIEVWILRSIRDDGHLPTILRNWLSNVPADDLIGIERITVVSKLKTMEYVGLYVPILSTIVVVWNKWSRGTNLAARILRINMEYTLYHEIGHHSYKHEFGQDADQEREADSYATGLFRSVYPIGTNAFLLISRALNLLFGGYRRRIRYQV